MRLRLPKLQEEDTQVEKISTENREGWEGFEGILHHQDLPYVPKLIKTQLISRHQNDLLVGPFGIDKTSELVARKYYWETLRHDIEKYIKRCHVFLISKALRHKPYNDLQLLPIPTH